MPWKVEGKEKKVKHSPDNATEKEEGNGQCMQLSNTFSTPCAQTKKPRKTAKRQY